METRDLNSVYVPLRLCYGLVPVAAGLDKFTNLLVDWKIYLPHFVTQIVPVDPSVFMRIVGGIEILAGLLVLAVLPRVGSAVVMAWLVLVGLMAAIAGYRDVFVRDVVMAVGAYTLCVVAGWRGEAWLPRTAERAGVKAHAAGH
jgi:uncharacterized membrane protein YphA (DoxX/SURF4 family)